MKGSYFDEYSKHMIDTEFYAQGVEDAFRKRLLAFRRRLSALMYMDDGESFSDVKQECDSEIDSFIDEERNKAKKDAEKQADGELNFLRALLLYFLGLSFSLMANRKRIVEEEFIPGTSIDSMFDELSYSLKTNVDEYVYNTYGTEDRTRHEKSFDRFMDTTARNYGSLIHTYVTGVQRAALRELVKGNRSVRMLYVSMLDGSTCVTCGSLSGSTFDSSEPLPHVPVHLRCRCYYVPVTEDTEVESYSRWFERQSDSVKYHILGKTRYFMYKSGVRIGQFSSEGRKLTLKELFSR